MWEVTILQPGNTSATVNIMSTNWATPVSPEFPTRIIVFGARDLAKLGPTALMAEAKASPIIRELAGTKMVLVTMYVPAGK